MELELEEVPSLTKLCLVRVAVTLWSTQLGKIQLNKLLNLEMADNRSKLLHVEMVDKLKRLQESIIYQLSIKSSLESGLKDMLERTGMVLDRFIRSDQNDVNENFCKSIHWTAFGLIDEVETWKKYARTKDSVTNFKAYCKYCCEHMIFEMWHGFSEDTKNSLRNEPWKNYLLMYWLGVLDGNMDDINNFFRTYNYNNNCTFHVRMFILTVEEFLGAASYFYSKLSLKEVNSLVEVNFKTKPTLSVFLVWFHLQRQDNPDLHHIVISLEKPLQNDRFNSAVVEQLSEVDFRKLAFEILARINFFGDLHAKIFQTLLKTDHVNKEIQIKAPYLFELDSLKRTKMNVLIKALCDCLTQRQHP